MKRILALDLGTATGWATHTADGAIVSGVETFKPGRFEGGGMRFLCFRTLALQEYAESSR